jgi:hypothetical protein
MNARTVRSGSKSDIRPTRFPLALKTESTCSAPNSALFCPSKDSANHIGTPMKPRGIGEECYVVALHSANNRAKQIAKFESALEIPFFQSHSARKNGTYSAVETQSTNHLSLLLFFALCPPSHRFSNCFPWTLWTAISQITVISPET